MLLVVVLVAVTLVKIDATALPSLTRQQVLAYATSMSRGELHAAANASRAANGLAPLTLNGALNNSAQAKAQHMADNDYWAHVAPDGTQPWYFFGAAGYSYTNAGENLAYGFDTSYAVNQGWMNSPGHRANILGQYIDVGFGIVNAPSFQGGQNTIVVAHYATPVAAPAPPPPPPPAPEPSPAPSSLPSSTASQPPTSGNAPAPTDSSEPTDTINDTSEAAPSEEAQENQSEESAAPVVPITTGATRAVSVFEQLRSGTIPGVALVSLTMTLVAALGFALTHRPIVRHAFSTGEHFVLAHPTFDAVTLTIALTLILTTTAAYLQ